MKKTITDNLFILIMLWVTAALFLNFIIPHRWFFQYENFYASDVCLGERQIMTGARWALFSYKSGGVDQAFYPGGSHPLDRREWDGRYFPGHTTSTWSEEIYLDPGEYEWRSTTLQIRVFYIFPVYIDDVKTNIFEVKEC